MDGPSDGWWDPKAGKIDGVLTDALAGSSRLLVTLKLHSRARATSGLSHVPDQCWGLSMYY